MKVTTDACMFGAWLAEEIKNEKLIINNCLDIGTGTGLLSLMLAQKTNDSVEIDSVELDKEAAKQARENGDASPWKERISVMPGDARQVVGTFCKNFDVIISNPPFYENELRSNNERKNLALHSESLRLEELLSLIKAYLNVDGTFFLLLPYKRNDEIKTLFKDHSLHIAKIIFVRQSTKHDYFRIMLNGKLNHRSSEETEIGEISIWDEKQQYTDEFVKLLKDYYLHL